MHDCDEVASEAPAIIFRGTWSDPSQQRNESNAGQMKRPENDHDGCASNEGHGS